MLVGSPVDIGSIVAADHGISTSKACVCKRETCRGIKLPCLHIATTLLVVHEQKSSQTCKPMAGSTLRACSLLMARPWGVSQCLVRLCGATSSPNHDVPEIGASVWSRRRTWRPAAPASTGAAVAEDTPGHISKSRPAAASAAASLLTREKVDGQPPFKRTTALPCTQHTSTIHLVGPESAFAMTPLVRGCGSADQQAQGWFRSVCLSCGVCMVQHCLQDPSYTCCFHMLLNTSHLFAQSDQQLVNVLLLDGGLPTTLAHIM